MRMLSEQDQNDVEVSWADQEAINTFSRLNNTYSDVEHDLAQQREAKEALDDLAMELELADQDEPVLYRIADSFLSLPHQEAMQRLEADQKAADEQIDRLKHKLDEYEESMKRLKAKLYAKFGDNISELPFPAFYCGTLHF